MFLVGEHDRDLLAVVLYPVTILDDDLGVSFGTLSWWQY
jgi:hypothetical protein